MEQVIKRQQLTNSNICSDCSTTIYNSIFQTPILIGATVAVENNEHCNETVNSCSAELDNRSNVVPEVPNGMTETELLIICLTSIAIVFSVASALICLYLRRSSRPNEQNQTVPIEFKRTMKLPKPSSPPMQPDDSTCGEVDSENQYGSFSDKDDSF